MCHIICKHIYFQVDWPNSALSTRRGGFHIYIVPLELEGAKLPLYKVEV